ncbi:MAG: hypothetical protein VYB54_10865 [Pseudomonadota bacterium]|nr:hypothetical protein [Pseudomonadota bacterium]
MAAARRHFLANVLERDGRYLAHVLPDLSTDADYSEHVRIAPVRGAGEGGRWLDIDSLPDVQPTLPLLFLFHVSRCGSTLVNRMIEDMPGVVSFSEPTFVADIMKLRGIDMRRRMQLLRRCLLAAVMARGGGDRLCVVRFTAWGSYDMAGLMAAFPAARPVFLYRDPLEVLVSQRDGPSRRVRDQVLEPRHEWPGIDHAALSRPEYIARMLGCLFGLARDAGRPMLLVSYSELPGAVFERLLPYLGLEIDDDVRAAMLARTKTYSKSRQPVAFSPDGWDKRARATAEERHLVKLHVAEAFGAVEEMLRRAINGAHG